MTPPKVLLLEASGPESEAIVAAAAARGIEAHAATNPDQHAVYQPGLLAVLAGVLLTDFASHNRAVCDIVDYCRRVGIDGVLTANEFLTPIAAAVCVELGLPGNDLHVALAARNKLAMATQFARFGVAMPRTFSVASHNDLAQLLSRRALSYPVVIKPADNAGSAAVTIAGDFDTAMVAYQRAVRLTRQPAFGINLDPAAVAQQYIPGAEYSVESVTQDGNPVHVCITSKKTTGGVHRVELGHSVPADVSQQATQRIHAEANKAIAAVGIRNGCSHTEVKLTPDGRCVVIEIAARPGAGHIGSLIELARGIRLFDACLDVSLGAPVDLRRLWNNHATVRFITSPAGGTLTSLTNVPRRGPNVPIVRVRTSPGQVVDATQDNRSRLGSFVVVGPDRAQVEHHADSLLERIHVQIAQPVASSALAST